jgi:hypothetical protein
MFRIIGDLFAQNKPVAFGRGYYDTIVSFSRKRPPGELNNSLRDAGVAKVWDAPIRTPKNYLIGWWLIVNQATEAQIRVLDANYEACGLILSKAHMAFEFDPVDGVEREPIVELLNNYTHLKGSRASDSIFYYGETTKYAISTIARSDRGERMPSKNAGTYHDRPGKLDGEDEKPRIELRLGSAQAIKNAGIHRPIDFLAVKPDQTFAKNFNVRDHGKWLTFKNRREAERLSFDNIEGRVRSTIHHARGDLTRFKHAHPNEFRRLIERNDIFQIDKRLHFVSIDIQTGRRSEMCKIV